jgi:hypothetical protein
MQETEGQTEWKDATVAELPVSNPPVRWGSIGLLFLAGLLLLGQQTLVFPGTSRLSEAIHNAMHVPWMMVMTFIVRVLTGRWLLTVPIIALIAVGSEFLQLLSGRTLSLFDLFSDFLGLSLAICLYALFVRHSRFTVWLPVLGMVCITLWTLRPIAMVFLSESWMEARGTLLYDGSDPRGFYFANFTAEAQFNMFSNESLKLTLTDAPWSGVHFGAFPGVGDSPDFLRISLTIDGDTPLTLGLSARYWRDEDPVWRDYVIPPGHSELMIPRADIEADRWLPSIQDLYLYGYRADAGRRFQVHQAEFIWDKG